MTAIARGFAVVARSRQRAGKGTLNCNFVFRNYTLFTFFICNMTMEYT